MAAGNVGVAADDCPPRLALTLTWSETAKELMSCNWREVMRSNGESQVLCNLLSPGRQTPDAPRHARDAGPTWKGEAVEQINSQLIQVKMLKSILLLFSLSDPFWRANRQTPLRHWLAARATLISAGRVARRAHTRRRTSDVRL